MIKYLKHILALSEIPFYSPRKAQPLAGQTAEPAPRKGVFFAIII